MSDLTPAALAAHLDTLSEDALYSALWGNHIQQKNLAMNAIGAVPIAALAALAVAPAITAPDPVASGKSFFQQLNQDAYTFFCGGTCGGTGTGDCADHFLTAINMPGGTPAAIAAVASLLTANLGWGAIVAGIIAAILVKFFFTSVITSLCSDWASALNA